MTAPLSYVAGFLLSDDGEDVLLVRKNRPEWQAGRLNAVGGKVEPGETPAEAMRREFREETGLPTGGPHDWELFVVMHGDDWAVRFYRLFAPRGVLDLAHSDDEPLEVWGVRDPELRWEALPNLSWLLPLAAYTHDGYWPILVSERVPPPGDD